MLLPVRVLDRILERLPRAAPLATLLVCLALAAGVSGLSLDNSFPALFREDDRHLAQYRRFRADFGDDDFLAVLLLDPAGPFSAGCQRSLFRLHELMAGSPEVVRVRSLAGLQRALAPEAGAPVDPEDLADLELSFGHSPLFLGDLIARDGSGAALYALVRPGPPAVRAALVEAIHRVPLEPGQRLHLAGPVAINHELDVGAQSDGRLFLPLAITGAALALLLFHGLAGLLPALVALLATVSFLGGLGWSGRTLNMVTVALPPVLFLLDLAAGLHLYRARPRRRSRAPGREALLRVGDPIVLCTLTTSLGFLALTTSQVRPVREMGLYGAFGLAFGWMVVNLLVPAALNRSPTSRSDARPGDDVGRRLVVLARWLFHRPVPALLLSLLALIGGALGLSRLRTSLSALSFLRPDGAVRAAILRGERSFHGFSPGEVILEGPPGTFLEPAHLRRLLRIEEALVRAGGATGSMGLTSVLRHGTMMDRAEDIPSLRDFRLPGSREDVEEILRNLPDSLRPELTMLVDPGRGRTRIQVRLPTGAGRQIEEVIRRWEPLLAELEAETGWRTSITGLVPMLVRMQSYLVSGFRWSFLLAALVIFVPLLLLARSPLRALLAAIPNLLPVVVVMGAMDGLGYTLDAGTCMVASVALGIAVDDTLHLVHGLEVENRRVPEVLVEVGPALVWTTVAGCAGFAILGLSAFPPMARFGVLVTLTLAVALVADLALLPLLLGDASRWARVEELD